MRKRQYSTFGIHALKTVALLCQVDIHAQAWLTQTFPGEVNLPDSALLWKSLLFFGGLSMAVPMTAAAVLRLSPGLQPENGRIPDFKWSPYIILFLLLAAVESCKGALVYGLPVFFEWEALHMIAVSLFLILAIGRYSIKALWAVAISIVALTPALIHAVSEPEAQIMNGASSAASSDFLSTAFSLVILFLVLALGILIGQQKNILPRYKFRLWLILAGFGGIGLYLCQQIPPSLLGHLVIKTLGIGILVGTKSGIHVWGLFPWAGVTIMGYLIYDVLIRNNGSAKFQAMAAALGIFLISVFFAEFSQSAVGPCSPKGHFAGFGGQCFNRTPALTILILGIFLLALPFALWAERVGLENKYVRAISRSILWIYLFETAVLIFAAKWWVTHISNRYLFFAFSVLAVAACCLLAILIDRMPWTIHLTLKKTEKAND